MKIQDSEILRRSSVFRFVSDEHFEAIEPLLQEEHYEFGEVIVKQGDPANSFYVLTSGRARALKIKSDGEEIPLGVLKPGDSFGEAALAEGGTRNATVRCSTAVDVLRIDRDDFLQLVRRVPDLKQYIESTGRNRALQSFLYQFSNFGRLPAPVLRGMIDKLTPVTFEKGNLIIREGDNAGPLYVIEKGRARAFAGLNGRERNLAFYREGDFFGELSILNDSPRAASVEAFTDCQLLSLELKSVRDLRRRFPEFDKLLSERLARYEAKTEARVPLDFATELLPAETQVHDKVQLDGQQPPNGDRWSRRAVRRRARPVPQARQTPPKDRSYHADRRDGLRCGLPRNDLPTLWSQGKPGTDSTALSHGDRWHQPKSDFSGRHRTWVGGASIENLAPQSPAVCRFQQ